MSSTSHNHNQEPPTGPRGGRRSRAFPFISVIVPTHDRATTLPHLFQALAGAIYPAASLELIVVDNSSRDDTEAIIVRWQAHLPFQVQYHRKENRGPAAARNFGAARARGQILAFTDSDCIPAPAWLRNASRGFEDGVGVVCGPIVALPGSSSESLLNAYVEETMRETGLYPTANLFVLREAFGAAGGFDERFGLFPWGGLVGGEDTDLAWRVKRAGHLARFLPDVVVTHQPSPSTVPDLLLRPVRVQIMPELVRSIPELRETFLWKRYFISPLHGSFHLAWAGLAVAALSRRKLPLLATLPWLLGIRPVVAEKAKHGGPLQAAAAFGLVLEGFSLHTLAVIAASIRARRLVL